jgi:YegS/Rv2252/BmrU family lipid kinase
VDKRDFIFIVNPVSGTGKQKNIEKTITEAAVRHQANVQVEFTQRAGHAHELAKKYAAEQAYAVIAVGGDGSVNEVGKALAHTSTVLGIVPMGSGNGLARHLKIPLPPARAVEHVFTGKVRIMDIGRLENHVFLSTAGFGFDAHVAHLFAQQKKRGFGTYVKTVRKQMFSYDPFEFTVKGGGKILTDKAFMLSVANIPQFGNNFTINPLATENDGLLNATVIKPFPRYRILSMMARFFRNNVNRSKYFQNLDGDAFTIEIPHLYAHVDGEPVFVKEHTFTCSVDKSCLQVIAGK